MTGLFYQETKVTKNQWDAFCDYKKNLKKYCEQWKKYAEQLIPLQKKAAEKDTPDYPLETPIVYNTAYDDLTENDKINVIVIGDNPGKDEQLKKNQKYLVGQSGKLAASFFAKNPQLQTDFRKNAIIMNKTPIHTAKTAHLKYLAKNGGDEIKNLILESQKIMANMAADLHQKLIENRAKDDLIPQLWLVGYSELKKNGLFTLYRDTLKSAYQNQSNWNQVFVYQHFSMNCFNKDLKNFMEKTGFDLVKSLDDLGHFHRDEIFGEN